MKRDDLQSELRGLKLNHLTETELAAYCDQELDQISRRRIESHIKGCVICERSLDLLREEGSVLREREASAEDLALAKRLTGQS